jgi:hypothetical protein
MSLAKMEKRRGPSTTGPGGSLKCHCILAGLPYRG